MKIIDPKVNNSLFSHFPTTLILEDVNPKSINHNCIVRQKLDRRLFEQ